MNDPDITRFLESRFSEHSEADLEAYIQGMNANPDVYFLAMIRRDTGDHIGNIKLGPVEGPHNRGDIGIVVGERDCWGQGYASEAISVLSEWAFVDLGLRKLTASAYSTNVGSVRAFQRAGFHIEGTRRDHYESDDGLVDVVLMARFADGCQRSPRAAG